MRQTRAIERDQRFPPTVAPPDPQVQAHLEALIHPATSTQVASSHALGLRDRSLTLPVLVAFVLSLIWRHLGSVSEAVRVLGEEGFLWVSPQSGSQPAVSERLRCLPAVLFERVLEEVLPQTLAARPGSYPSIAPGAGLGQIPLYPQPGRRWVHARCGAAQSRSAGWYPARRPGRAQWWPGGGLHTRACCGLVRRGEQRQ